MLLKDGKNYLEDNYHDIYFKNINPIQLKEIYKYLNIERVGGDTSLRHDFLYKTQTQGNTTFYRAIWYTNEYKEYTIILGNNNLIGAFDCGKAYLIDEENFLLINNGILEHYHIHSDRIRLTNSFPVDVNSLCMKGFFNKGIIINGRIYNIKDGKFTTPEFDEIISLMDYKKNDSIIYDENICPKELRIALQNVVENGEVSLGIKQVIADEPLINLEKEEYVKTIVICVIDKFNGCFFDYFYYDPLNNKIISKKIHDPSDVTSKVKERLNEITDFLNSKKAEELENSLYVDATKKISSILPEEDKKRILKTCALIKQYKNNNQ